MNYSKQQLKVRAIVQSVMLTTIKVSAKPLLQFDLKSHLLLKNCMRIALAEVQTSLDSIDYSDNTDTAIILTRSGLGLQQQVIVDSHDGLLIENSRARLRLPQLLQAC